MLVTLGFLVAALLLVVLLPAYRRRIERFTTEGLKRALPLTEAEIRADKDRLRAEYAMEVHRLETKLDEGTLAAARQSVEINRRDAKIQDLMQTISAHKMSVEEHENARRVLEQAILDRLPKVEQRLSDTRKLLAARDREILQLTEAGAKQAMAVEEAAQIHKQQADEIYRLKAALDTRAARNRETVGDPRFDGEVALRSEIEALRATSREQAALIEKLQKGEDEDRTDGAISKVAFEKLKSELARVEAALLAQRVSEADVDVEREKLEARIRELEGEEQQRQAEIVKLKAALGAYEKGATADIADKAQAQALKAEVEEQQKQIQSLRAEIAAANERLSRQAQHFRDEVKRLGAAADAARSATEPGKLSLAERITAPKVPVPPRLPAADGSEVAVAATTPPAVPRGAGFLKAVNGGAAPAESAEKDAAHNKDLALANAGANSSAEVPRRRGRLLDRISGLDKSG